MKCCWKGVGGYVSQFDRNKSVCDVHVPLQLNWREDPNAQLETGSSFYKDWSVRTLSERRSTEDAGKTKRVSQDGDWSPALWDVTDEEQSPPLSHHATPRPPSKLFGGSRRHLTVVGQAGLFTGVIWSPNHINLGWGSAALWFESAPGKEQISTKPGQTKLHKMTSLLLWTFIEAPHSGIWFSRRKNQSCLCKNRTNWSIDWMTG